MNSTRLFYAALLPNAMKNKLEKCQQDIVIRLSYGRKIRKDMLHMTLHFLGDINPDEIPRLCDVLDSAAEKLEPFNLRIEKIGAFTQSKGKLLYAEAAIPQSVFDLAKKLKQESGTGDMKQFKPHITLLRNADKHIDLPKLNTSTHCHFETNITDLCLMESIYRQKRPEYVIVHRTSLT